MAKPTANELRTTELSLSQELAALRHELRRVRDGLVRNPTHELEQRAQQLNKNIALCERELEQNRAHRLKLRPSAE